MRVQVDNGMDVAKRIVFLAWIACRGAFGMGALRDYPSAKEEEVWDAAYNRTDYPGGRNPPHIYPKLDNEEVHCDYVFGRMMKFDVKWGSDWVELSDGTPRSDDQAWCTEYKTYKDLVDAAIKSLNQPVGD